MGLRFAIHEMPYGEHPAFGRDHLLARADLLGGELAPMMFSVSRVTHSSASALQDPERARAVLVDYNLEMGNIAGAEMLARAPHGFRFLMSGQQPGLLLGPLYGFLKIVSVLAWCGRLRIMHPELLPAFWIAGEDHDILEVNRCRLGDAQFVCRFPGDISTGSVPPVHDVSLEHCRHGLIEFMTGVLPDNEFRPWLLDMVQRVSMRDYSSFFATLTATLFRHHPVVLVEPRLLRAMAAPFLGRIVEDWDGVQAALVKGGECVRRMGLTPPLRDAGLFRIGPSGRRKIGYDDGRFQIDGEWLTAKETAAMISDDPEGFSPGAALRPLVQDGLLPVAAYIAGPSELYYLWQIDPLYDWLEVRRSLLAPRISATFLDPPVTRLMERLSLALPDLFSLDEAPAPALESSGADLGRIRSKGNELIQELRAAGGGEKWLRKSIEGIDYNLSRALRRLHEERLAAAGTGGERRNRVREAVYPGGKLQERVVSPFYFLAHHGEAFIDRCIECLNPDCRCHQVVCVSAERSES
ncbi:bacillithiol biosynthesis BshC [bacterium]|nr:bacillithiol biosynthesis BshC [candidate division CSSED10-310 bacterium]